MRRGMAGRWPKVDGEHDLDGQGEDGRVQRLKAWCPSAASSGKHSRAQKPMRRKGCERSRSRMEKGV